MASEKLVVFLRDCKFMMQRCFDCKEDGLEKSVHGEHISATNDHDQVEDTVNPLDSACI